MSSVVIVGIGQMASVLAHGLLRRGHPVFPVTRSMSMSTVAKVCPVPELVIVAVGEDALDHVLSETPPAWRDRLVLLQNELRPSAWAQHGISAPTVLSAWFEKKKGIEVRALRSSPVMGPSAELVVRALSAIEVPAVVLPEAALHEELAKKNLYILTLNIAGLMVDGSVMELWTKHADLVGRLFDALFELESRLLGRDLDRDAQWRSLAEVIEAAPERRARGRTAPARLERALLAADRLGLSVAGLREISSKIK